MFNVIDTYQLTEVEQADLVDLICSDCAHSWVEPKAAIRVEGEYELDVICPECSSIEVEQEGLSHLEDYRQALRESWKNNQLSDLETCQSRQSRYAEKPYHKGFRIDETMVTPLQRVMRSRKGWKGPQPAKRGGYHAWICMKLGVHLNLRPSEHPWSVWKRPQVALEALTGALADGNDWLSVKHITQDIMVPGPEGWQKWTTRERIEILVSSDVLPEEQLREFSSFLRLSPGKQRIMQAHNPPFYSWRDFTEYLEAIGDPLPTDEEVCSHVTQGEHMKANMPHNFGFKFTVFPEGNEFTPLMDIPEHPSVLDVVMGRIEDLERERAVELITHRQDWLTELKRWYLTYPIHKGSLTKPAFVPLKERTQVPRWEKLVRKPMRTNLKVAKQLTKLEQKEPKKEKNVLQRADKVASDMRALLAELKGRIL